MHLFLATRPNASAARVHKPTRRGRSRIRPAGWIGLAVLVSLYALPALGQESEPVSLEQRVNRLAERAGTPADSAEPQAAAGRRIGPSRNADASPAILDSAAPGFEPGETSRQLGGGAASGGNGWALSTITALGVVLGLILLLRWLWLRMGGRVVAGPSPVVETLSRTSVAPKNHVVLVRVGSRILVCGDSPSGLRTLADINDEQEVAELLSAVSASRDASLTRGFNQVLNRFHGEHDVSTEGGDHGEHRIDRTRESVSALLSNIRSLAGKGGGA